MTIIIPLFAAAFLIGYLIYQLRVSETRGVGGLHDELKLFRAQIESLEDRVRSLEAIAADDDAGPALDLPSGEEAESMRTGDSVSWSRAKN